LGGLKPPWTSKDAVRKSGADVSDAFFGAVIAQERVQLAQASAELSGPRRGRGIQARPGR
jgi:hypothetical protein